MILEKIKEIKRAEQNAAEKKLHVQAQVKKILSDAEENGKQFIITSENYANEKAKKLIDEAEKKASEIIEKAKYNSKVETVTSKVDAELNIVTTVKMIIDEVVKEYSENLN